MLFFKAKYAHSQQIQITLRRKTLASKLREYNKMNYSSCEFFCYATLQLSSSQTKDC